MHQEKERIIGNHICRKYNLISSPISGKSGIADNYNDIILDNCDWSDEYLFGCEYGEYSVGFYISKVACEPNLDFKENSFRLSSPTINYYQNDSLTDKKEFFGYPQVFQGGMWKNLLAFQMKYHIPRLICKYFGSEDGYLYLLPTAIEHKLQLYLSLEITCNITAQYLKDCQITTPLYSGLFKDSKLSDVSQAFTLSCSHKASMDNTEVDGISQNIKFIRTSSNLPYDFTTLISDGFHGNHSTQLGFLKRCDEWRYLEKEKFCDNQCNCFDKTDEECNEYLNPENKKIESCRLDTQIKCLDYCLPLHMNCDKLIHCPDGSDETSCRQMMKTFIKVKSPNYTAILSPKKKCHLIYNSFGYLETKIHDPRYPFGIFNCNKKFCPGGFLCTEHKFCISIENVCDGINHCWSNEDEFNCSRL
ncbi:DgyrCDS14928 [Dimorphilus gyrociliatus]|uniref:DgyrCDS14928 n=1 Tax=Dimorphilus gyrociliatus TaxID=2664684 RepID=A0A7I8WFI7_9ANNE|nr:DgyrCDS14928 [Dimorphilus gyrociliatus]